MVGLLVKQQLEKADRKIYIPLMKYRNYIKYHIVLALLFIGSAFSLISCEQKQVTPTASSKNIMTQQSDTLTIIQSENGMKSYRFYAPLLERYELAQEPYMEFRRGIKIETFEDTTQNIETTFVADYAIFYENQKLWEAKGNVVSVNAKGQILETEQLFWNQKTKRIYSNVYSTITQKDDVIMGEGFESDESMEDFIFRKPQGRVSLNVEPTKDE